MATMQRASYQLILAKYKERNKGSVRLTQSSIILIQPIQSNTKTYNFPILQSDNQSPALPQEQKLNLNDEFITYQVGYYLRSGQRGTTGGLTGAMYLTYVPVELNGALAPLNAAYEGKMTIDINGIKRLENWDMLRHKCIPRTQYQDFSVGIPQATQPSICYNEAGVTEMQPMITFTGAKKNEITISLSDSISSGLTYDFATKTGALVYEVSQLVLIFRGMLAQNAAKFQ